MVHDTVAHVQAILDAMASLLILNNTSIKLIVAGADDNWLYFDPNCPNCGQSRAGVGVRWAGKFGPVPMLWGGSSFLMWQAIISSIRTHPVTCGIAAGRKPTPTHPFPVTTYPAPRVVEGLEPNQLS